MSSKRNVTDREAELERALAYAIKHMEDWHSYAWKNDKYIPSLEDYFGRRVSALKRILKNGKYS